MAGTTNTLRVGGIQGGTPAEIDANSKVRFVDDSEIINLSDLTVDLLKLFGGVSQFTFDNDTPEWTEHDVWARRVTLSSVGAMVGGAQDGNLDDMNVTAQSHRYPIGTIFVNIDKSDELVRVEGITDADNLNVRRGYAGSTVDAADWATTDNIMVAGFSMHEDDVFVFRPSYILDFPFNIHQVQHVALRQTWHRAGVRLYGHGTGQNDFADQVTQTMAEQLVTVEEQLVVGRRFVGSANEPGTAGGLDFFINLAGSGAQITSLAGAAVTRKDIEDLVQNLAYAVGRQNAANLIICDYWFDRKLASFFDSKERLEPDTSIAGLELQRLRVPGLGILTVVPHVAVPEGHAFFVKLENIKVGTMEGLGQPHIGDVGNPGGTAAEEQGVAGPFQGRYFYMDWTAFFKGMPGFGLIDGFSLTQ